MPKVNRALQESCSEKVNEGESIEEQYSNPNKLFPGLCHI